MMRVRFPLPAPYFVAGKEYVLCWQHIARVAQLVERTLGKGEVTGSTPVVSTMIILGIDINIYPLFVCSGVGSGRGCYG